MSYVLTVIHPPTDGATYGKAVTLDPVSSATDAARQAVPVLTSHAAVTRRMAKSFSEGLWRQTAGVDRVNPETGVTFRIDLADNAPHPCPCEGCARLVLPTDHAYSYAEDACCLGCFTWDRNVEGCLPENTAHPAEGARP